MKAKYLFSFIVIISTVFYSFNIEAKGNWKIRSECSNWNYYSYARVCDLLFCNSTRTWTCDQDAVASASKGCGYHIVTNGPSGYSSYGWVDRRRCSHGVEKSDLYTRLYKLNLLSGDDPGLAADSIVGDIQFNSSSVSIGGINGYLYTSDEYFWESYTVQIWQPSDENDTIPDSREILWMFKITISQGQVITEGNIDTSDFQIIYLGSSVKVVFNNMIKNYLLPSGVDTTDIVIMMETEGGGVDSETMMPSSVVNNIINPDRIFPNPATNTIQVELYQLSVITDPVFYEIYNIMGEVILKNDVKSMNGSIFNLDISNLIDGEYILLIATKNKKLLLTKFVKQ